MIAFAQPWALLSLLSLPLLVYLYRLRPKREDATVSSLMFWHAAIKIRDSNSSNLQRLLRDLNLMVLLALAALLSLALAQPQWQLAARHSQDAVLIVDVSASMGARSGNPGRTRLDEAKNVAREIIAALPEGARLLLMTSARYARAQSGFESDRDLLQALVSRLQPTEEAGRPTAAIAQARALLRSRAQAQLHFVTDGAFDSDAARVTVANELHLVGDQRANVAITRFDIRAALHTEQSYEVFVAVRNFGDESTAAPLTVEMDAVEIAKRDIVIEANSEVTLSLPMSGRLGKRATVQIDYDDALEADNAAYMAFASSAQQRIMLYTPGNFYLETALRALPDTILDIREQADNTEVQAAARGYDVVVFDRVAPPPLDTGKFLFIDVAATAMDPDFNELDMTDLDSEKLDSESLDSNDLDSNNLESNDLDSNDRDSIARDSIESTIDKHNTATRVSGVGDSALMRDLDLRQLRINAHRPVKVQSSVTTQKLFWSAESDLALSTLQPDKRAVYLGFDLLESNFPRQTAFPLFIRRSVEWLTTNSLAAGLQTTQGDSHERRRQVPAGESFTLEFPVGTEEISIAAPDGTAEAIALIAPRYTFANTSQAGLYQYNAAGVRNYIAANLTDESESDINRRVPLRPVSPVTQSVAAAGILKLALWPYLAWLALVLLLVEWWLWCTRREHA